MTDFRFAEPNRVLWLWALVAVLAALVWIEFRGSASLYRFLSPLMAGRLVQRPSLGKRIMRLVYLSLAGLALILALMRPQWGIRYEKFPHVGAQIMICLDVSRSMMAEDVTPNRLERAKAEIVDLLDLLDGEQVGLIAFAGNATVLCPLTTDFGFLKLILGETGTHTVGRGGTRLEEPIRKAVAGFGEAADLSRVILLITDGDDLDSYPLEAAKEAREKGVKVLAVGFGDESGSRISVTDPKTGLKSFIRDERDQPVVSRLNGELLREMALVTEGAYIPAGTGSLDLAEIHATHIVPLLRAETEGTLERVENEGFQWAILASLVFLMMSFVVTRRPSAAIQAQTRSTSRVATRAAAMVLILCLIASVGPAPATAQPNPDDQQPLVAVEADASGSTNEESASDTAAIESVSDPLHGLSPREAYNLAVGVIRSNPELASSGLATARSNAGADGELRFRVLFNLGWLTAERADKLIDSEPHEALREMRTAIDWYQKAIRLRPKNGDARYNLEIMMRRAMALADALAQRDYGDLTRRLDELIGRQREAMSAASDVLTRFADASREMLDSQDARRDFRRLSVNERQILSDAEAISEDVANRLAALANQSASPPPSAGAQQTPDADNPWEPAKLEATQRYLTLAIQRLAKARSQFKLREGHRGYRRAHLGLQALKSARDQLREPGQRLNLLLADARELLDQTNRLAEAESPRNLADPQPLPSWLDAELLSGTQGAIVERTDEIAAQLQVPDDVAANGEPSGLSQQNLDDVRAAGAALQDASDLFRQSFTALEQQRAASAVLHQLTALEKLNEAIEYLIELRGLIELTYRDASRVEQTLQQWHQLPESVDREAIRKSLQAVHDKNMGRAVRMASKIDDQLAKLQRPEPLGPEPPKPPSAPPEVSPQEEQRQAEEQRLNRARELLASAQSHMEELQESMPVGLEPLKTDSTLLLEEAESGEAESEEDNLQQAEDENEEEEPATTSREAEINPALAVAQSHANQMVAQLTELRRLFYSVAEHLRETAQQQADVNDETQSLAQNEQPKDVSDQLGPLRARQSQIREQAKRIREALREISQKSAEASADTEDQLDPIRSSESPEQAKQRHAQTAQYAQASEHLGEAVAALQQTLEGMAEEPPSIREIREPQDDALNKMLEALALLQPPQQQQNQDNSGDNQQDPQPQEGEREDQQEQQQQQQGMSAQQLLQLVRDREAQRRKDQQRRAAARRESVEKDW